ncbi:MAG: DUF1598 domain-containing protein, partial [Planctomycetes bacterium]|nr:DUF1598 domain-containing protein [Planctomycetota bacterium]
MSRRPELGARPQAAVVWLLVSTLFLWTGAAEVDAQDAAIQEMLDAGEFAPAVAAARRIAVPRERDAVLAQIAAAQARAGARQASVGTASQISDDRARAQALSDMAAQPLGGRGGGTMADFDSLIDLITTTIAPESWEDVGGVGTIAPFPTGVYVDPQGVLRPLVSGDDTGQLGALRDSSRPRAEQEDVRRSSPLRKVSLPRLEKHVQLLLAAGRRPTEAMQVLAGLQRIEYVFVYPKSGDLVLAGPAGDWRTDEENRVVGVDSGRPVVRLDDLVVVLRHVMRSPDARFGCLIVPRQEALARVQTFLAQPVSFNRSGDRRAWLDEMRATLGTQDIEVYGLDPRTRAARLMIEADYRMKLVGMGLEAGVPGLESYLNRIKIAPGEAPPPMGVLRWWFTLDYDAVRATDDRAAFALEGRGVKVLSENELLTAEGERVHTGASEPLNRQFARAFTEHFEALSRKYPVYAEFRNLCDLALAAALLREEDLPSKTGWHLTCFGDGGSYPVELGATPRTVETVANYRVAR